jgi:hypothetical protein
VQLITVASVEELREKVDQFDSTVLFRGQTMHLGDSGHPSIGTSFDRNGCIPPQMIKWSNYASNILRPLLASKADLLEFTHAILQHYGWRSWFVDCTTSSAVAAWFASHVYKEDLGGGIFEDYDERPVHLECRFAHYDAEEGDAHLYVIDRGIAAAAVGLTDLSEMAIGGSRPRAQAQSAFLLGPLRNQVLPQQVYLAHISGPRSVFRDLARDAGLNSASDLFPPQSEDQILQVLLSLPWKIIGWLGVGSSGIPFCRRSLSLPEYHPLRFKIAPPNLAFYESKSIGTPPQGDGIIIPIPNEALYGNPESHVPARFPKVMDLLKAHGTLIFETDELLRHPHMVNSHTYQKGLTVLQQEDGSVALCELVVEHPGLDLVSAGPARGWFYKVDQNGTWIHHRHEEECICGDDSTHLRHLECLKIVEDLLPRTLPL